MTDDQFFKETTPKDNPEGEAYGFIQWKGTSVCMDTHCKCGYHGHVDRDFFYCWQCSQCGRKYRVGSNIKLIELNPEQAGADFAKHFMTTGEED